MRADKVREQDSTELQNHVHEAQEQLFRLRFQIGMGQTDGLKKYRELKRDRARMLSVLRERELDPAKAAEAKEKTGAGTGRGKKGK
jgi:large subunit ribosomal protein L29